MMFCQHSGGVSLFTAAREERRVKLLNKEDECALSGTIGAGAEEPDLLESVWETCSAA